MSCGGERRGGHHGTVEGVQETWRESLWFCYEVLLFVPAPEAIGGRTGGMGEDRGGLIPVGTRWACVVVVIIIIVRAVSEEGIRHVYRVCRICRVSRKGVDASFRERVLEGGG